MKKLTFLMVAAVLLAAVAPALAMDDGLGVSADVTWVSKYIWRGFDVLDDKAAVQPSVTFDLYDSGFTFKVWASFAGSSKGNGRVSTVNKEEWNYVLTYADSVNDGDPMKTDYAISYIYYDYPDMPSKDADLQEFNLALAWPDLCTAGIVPSYQIYYLWASKGGGAVRDAGGFLHRIGLAYDYAVPGFLPDNPEQVFSFGWNIVYNDAAGASTHAGTEIDHDWSHMLYSVSTQINCPMSGGKITPAVYYQTSMEDTVNNGDEFWCGITYGLTF